MTEGTRREGRSVPTSSSGRLESFPSRLTGFPLGNWAFALRTWIAMMAALYVAFWLQFQNAYSAAVCVGILALPTRGQAFEKAIYRAGATIIGFLAALAMAGLFNSARDLFILAFAAWMGICGYVASLLHGSRAYTGAGQMACAGRLLTLDHSTISKRISRHVSELEFIFC
jgi:Fusaric acid resistance protein family